jgi:hypothetical protein
VDSLTAVGLINQNPNASITMNGDPGHGAGTWYVITCPGTTPSLLFDGSAPRGALGPLARPSALAQLRARPIAQKTTSPTYATSDCLEPARTSHGHVPRRPADPRLSLALRRERSRPTRPTSTAPTACPTGRASPAARPVPRPSAAWSSVRSAAGHRPVRARRFRQDLQETNRPPCPTRLDGLHGHAPVPISGPASGTTPTDQPRGKCVGGRRRSYPDHRVVLVALTGAASTASTTRSPRRSFSRTWTSTLGAATIRSTRCVGQTSVASRSERRGSACSSPARRSRFTDRVFLNLDGGCGDWSSLSRLASSSPRVATGIFKPFGPYCTESPVSGMAAGCT